MTRVAATIAFALLLSACSDRLAPVFAGMAGGPQAAVQMHAYQQGLAQQQAVQRQHDAGRPEPVPRQELDAALATYRRVFEETDNPFEARRQTKLQHGAFFLRNPEILEQIDVLTAVMWQLRGGEYAGAVCYMRGFQFGTAHYDQCVYEVKMEGGTGFSATAMPPPASQAQRSREKWPPPPAVVGPVEQGGKVYDPSECVGPVIMGRCHGTILPNKAYHPTCYGTWLNGECTGPMF